MISPGDELVAVGESSQVGQARRAAVRAAELSGLTEEERGKVAIVATELAKNLVRYAKAGRLFVRRVQDAGCKAVEMVAVDSGPGIADLQRSMQDGVSTGGTPGTGLGAVRRLSHEFDIYTVVGQGTLVLSCIGGSARKRAARAYQWSAVSTPAPREVVCGDAWRIAEHAGELRVMIADGLGHGPLAAEAAIRAVAVFDEDPASRPAAFCQRAHQALAGSRGAALAMGHVSAAGKVTYAGVGNIAGALVGGTTSRGLSSQNGTVGAQMRRVQEFDYEWPDRGALIMHSDGLTSRWSLEAYPGLAARHPAIIAGVLYRDCLRGRDDATVLVVKQAAKAKRT